GHRIEVDIRSTVVLAIDLNLPNYTRLEPPANVMVNKIAIDRYWRFTGTQTHPFRPIRHTEKSLAREFPFDGRIVGPLEQLSVVRREPAGIHRRRHGDPVLSLRSERI